MKSEILKYLIIGICCVVMSTGPICMSYVNAYSPLDGKEWLLLVPFTMITVGEVMITWKWLLPRYLEKGRYVVFGVGIALLSYLLNVLAVVIEWWAHGILHLTYIVRNPITVWLWVEAVAASVAGVIILAGSVLWKLYDRYLRESLEEERMKREFEEKTRRFKEYIRIGDVADMLDEAIEEVGRDAREANRRIRKLSDYLRVKLYERREAGEKMPPRKIRQGDMESKGVDFLLKRRYRRWRHFVLILMCALLSSGFLFEYPDKPAFQTYNIVFSVVFFVVISGLFYLNIYVVYPAVERIGGLRLYVWGLGGFMMLIGWGMYMLGSRDAVLENDHGLRIPDWVMVLSILGNILLFFFLFAGTASIRQLQRNFEGRWRMRHLEAEMARGEYEYLQSQINPHFIFNVLNNAGILSYENPEESEATLRSLRYFLGYMLREESRGETTIGEECRFMKNYLVMEQSSGQRMEVEMKVEEGMMERRLPPLLLITFVENAVKHSVGSGRGRRICIEMGMEGGKMVFSIRNSIGKRKEGESGGLGLENTRRRLDLLYADGYSLTAEEREGEYYVELKLDEIENEVYSGR